MMVRMRSTIVWMLLLRDDWIETVIMGGLSGSGVAH